MGTLGVVERGIDQHKQPRRPGGRGWSLNKQTHMFSAVGSDVIHVIMRPTYMYIYMYIYIGIDTYCSHPNSGSSIQPLREEQPLYSGQDSCHPPSLPSVSVV